MINKQLAAARAAILNSISGSYAYTEQCDIDADKYISEMLCPKKPTDSLWEDIGGMSVNSASITAVYRRIYAITLAYRHKESRHYHSEKALDAVRASIKTAGRLWYNKHTEMYGNWWHFLIGVPSQLCKILAVIWDKINDDEREEYAAALERFCLYQAYCGVEPKLGEAQAGANLVNISNYDYIMGVLTGNEQKIEKAVSLFYTVFDYKQENSGLDGFYRDGSFLQHGVPYNGSYGREFLNGIVDMAESLHGTKWGFREEHFERINEWIDKGYLPFVFKGSMMDIVNGRAIVRNNTDKKHGYQVGRTILHYAQLLSDETRRRRYCETVKYWFLKSSPTNGITWKTDCDELSAKIILNGKYDMMDHTPTGMYVFPNMERAAYRPCADWAAGFAVYSSRIPTYELTNGENKKGWYTGSGAVYIYNSDDAHYARDYWLAADMYSIPGTTVDSAVRYYDGEGSHYQDGDFEGKSSKPFAGGLSDGECGVMTMELEAVKVGAASDLTARKSYFAFPEGIMCIGSDISGGNGEVYTCVENRAADDFELTADGKSVNADGSVINARRIYLSGSCGRIGWYFPEGGSVEVKSSVRTASPSEVRHDSNLPDVTKRYLTLKLKHGCRPEDASYEYMIMPEITDERLTEYSAEPSISVLSKGKGIHAVYSASLKKTAAVFFERGEVNGLECSGAAIVIAEDNGSVSLADPSRLSEEITVIIDGNIKYEDNNDAVVSYDGNKTIIKFITKNKNGKSIKINAKSSK